jgi:hypothetical protein
VTCHGEGRGDAAGVKRQTTFGYDAREKVYTYQMVNSAGASLVLKGTDAGGIWRWTGEFGVGAGVTQIRTIVVRLSDRSYSISLEASQDGANWTVHDQAVLTKIEN